MLSLIDLFLMFLILFLLYENAAIASVDRRSIILLCGRRVLARVMTCNKLLKLLVREHCRLISLSEDLPLRRFIALWLIGLVLKCIHRPVIPLLLCTIDC